LFPNFLKFKEAQEQTQHLLELAQEEARVKEEELKQMKSGT
jgi:hypothetical protein